VFIASLVGPVARNDALTSFVFNLGRSGQGMLEVGGGKPTLPGLVVKARGIDLLWNLTG
jgi:hypothetical protein